MQRIFMDFPVPDDGIVVGGEDAYHLLRVLRMKPGAEFIITDPDGRDHCCVITGVEADRLLASKKSTRNNLSEPPYRVTLYQGMPKGDKTDTIVQKAVELGAAHIVFVVTERSVSRPDEQSAAKKTVRLSRIAAGAAAQCGRAGIPSVRFLPDFTSALVEAVSADLPLFCYEGGGTPLPDLLGSVNEGCFAQNLNLSVLIGPEGGFSEREAREAEDAGCRFCTLGPRILRTETAGIHVLSCLSYQFEK